MISKYIPVALLFLTLKMLTKRSDQQCNIERRLKQRADPGEFDILKCLQSESPP